MRRIVVDAMGGERGPEQIIRGAAQASLVLTQSEIILVGDAALIGKELMQCRHDGSRVRVHHARDAIHQHDLASEATLARPGASIVVAVDMVAKGEGDALVCAGNTGAVVLACARRWEKLPQVQSPALCAVYPTELRRGKKNDPFALLLDVGATLDAGANDLVAFAHMGASYARIISHNPRPRVALLSSAASTGESPSQIAMAREILSTDSELNFIGNVEGIDIPRGVADVVICSGYIGNVVITMLEGVSETIVNMARYAYKERLVWRAALKALSSGLGRLKDLTDWDEYAGAPLLGYQHLLIQAHGHSKAPAIANAIRLADKALRLDLCGSTQASLKTQGTHTSQAPPSPSSAT